MPVLVIGVGHPWRGDDAAGLLVARHLQKQQNDFFLVREMSGDAADLLNAWQEARAVIVVDAIHGQAAPGTIYRFDAQAEPLPADLFPACSTHAWGIAEAVALGHSLQFLPPTLIIYGIVGQNFDLRAGLSPAVAIVIPEVTRRILWELETIQIGTP